MADDDAALRAADPVALRLITEAEAQLDALGKTFDADALLALRTLISSYPQMGSPGAGDVAASLFMLLGRFIASGCADREAVAVHLRAWRLLLTSEADAEAQARLMSGLRAILLLYADAQAA
ncbi:MAG: hypothetical protein AB1942_17935 [Pseudomonadota bacterium]